MNKIAAILTAAVMVLLAHPQSARSETTAGRTMAQSASAPPIQVGAQSVLRAYYVLPFFPFLWPVPPGHPAATPQAPQSPPHPPHPFVIWLPMQPPAIQPAPPATPAPAVVKPTPEPPATEPGVATVQPTPPQALPAGAEPEAGLPTGFQAPPTPAVERSPLPKEAAEVAAPPLTDMATTSRKQELHPFAPSPPAPPPKGEGGFATRAPTAEPLPDQARDTKIPPKEHGRPGAAPATKTKAATARPPVTKPAPQGATGKRKLCWRDGKLDVCR